MATTSSYPGSVDSLQAPASTLDGPPTHEDIHLEIADAVEKVETELGVNGRHRTVRNYADAAARDAANASPVEGHIAFLEDSNETTVYNGAAWQRVPEMQWGVTTVDTLTGLITFPVAFDTAPTVTAVPLGSSTFYNLQLAGAPTTTQVGVYIYDAAGSLIVGPAVVVHWMAFRAQA